MMLKLSMSVLLTSAKFLTIWNQQKRQNNLFFYFKTKNLSNPSFFDPSQTNSVARICHVTNIVVPMKYHAFTKSMHAKLTT